MAEVSLVAAIAAALTSRIVREASSQSTGEFLEQLKSVLSENRSSEDTTDAEAALDAVEADPDNPQRQQELKQTLFNIIASDDTFASNIVQMVAEDPPETSGTATEPIRSGSQTTSATNGTALRKELASSEPNESTASSPVRGFPGLTVSAASPQTIAGTDFSIFVLVQNPFDVPITIHHVQTHIPVDLVDVIQYRAKVARLPGNPESSLDKEEDSQTHPGPAWRFVQRRRLWREHPGVATAIGTEITPEEASNLFRSELTAGGDLNIGSGTTFSAVSFVLPNNPSSDSLDALMRRVISYRRGTLPVCLQPGDSVVRQFVLRTRSRIFFRPLSHSFQIQVSYSVDGEDHTGTIPYDLTIQAALGSISAGSVVGAALGTLVKSLSQPASASLTAHPLEILQAVAVSVMASIAVVVAFARKSSAQPLVSIEDFWGGLVIGFTVGYFGFQTFFGLFKSG